MMRRSDLRDAATIARTELAAMWRRLTNNRRRMLGVGVGVLQFVIVLPAVFFQPVLAFGRDLASATLPVGTVGALYFGAAVSGVYLGSMAAIGQNRIGSVGPLIRTAVPPAACSCSSSPASSSGEPSGRPRATLASSRACRAGGRPRRFSS